MNTFKRCRKGKSTQSTGKDNEIEDGVKNGSKVTGVDR